MISTRLFNGLSRHLQDRLAEPIHMNVLSVLVGAFGGVRGRIAMDLIRPRAYAFGILAAADSAKAMGLQRIAVLEFGVASGRGLRAMAHIAVRVAALTGVRIEVFGFDTGQGMPAPVDFRDHPEYYARGDFPMNEKDLRATLPRTPI